MTESLTFMQSLDSGEKAIPTMQTGCSQNPGPADVFYEQTDVTSRILIEPYLRESKAQLAQDLFALTVCGTLEPKFFVEFGATDGINLSNTWLLEKKLGWVGILAEPGRIWHDKLKINRSCLIDTRCVAKESGQRLRFLEVSADSNSAPELSALETFAENGDWASEIRKKYSISYEVETISLNDLLDAYDAPTEIQFLSIDTEGSELDILEGFDFSNRRILSICVEHNYQEPIRSKINTLLSSNGYKQVMSSVSRWDDWYVLQVPQNVVN